MSEFQHVYRPGSGPALLVLHGTGGDEHSLVDLAHYLSPDAKLLSPRGQSLDEGVPRFFRRLREGVLDQEDMRVRTGDLAEFLISASGKYGFELPVDALGYSNGANMALSLAFRRPELVRNLVLFRPMVPFEPEPVDLSGRRALIAAGRNDPLVTPAETERLAEILRAQGAEVEIRWSVTGHSLNREELDTAKRWMSGE